MSHVLPLDGALDFEVERMRKRIAELEAGLLKWRDDYERTKRHNEDPWVAVPIHQIKALLGEQK